MLLDKENMFSWKQAITVTANSENVIYLGGKNPAGYAGNDREIPLFLNIDETFTAAGAATLTVALQSSALENFGSGVVTHWSKTFALADLPAAGKVPRGFALPPDILPYARLAYTVATGPFTGGKLSAGVTASRQINN